jgi:FkbM family methyltransferase
MRGKAMGLHSLARIAPHLREPVRFCARQITRRHGLEAYRLRGSDVRILVRHSTGDLITLEEVLADRQYEPPSELAGLFEPNGRPISVADLGANVGLFSAWVLARRPDAQLVAFEPDPDNAAVLEQCLRINGRDAGETVVRAAAAPAAGELRFLSGELAASRQVEEGGIAVQAVDVFPYLERADFVKVDIEGGEWPILADSRFRDLPARALVLEYHPHLCPGPDPRATADALLADAGWTNVEHMDFDMPPGHGVLWAWR